MKWIRKNLWWLIPLAVADGLFFRWLILRGQESPLPEPVFMEIALTNEAVVVPPWKGMVFPTDRTNLLSEDDLAGFQPTASGNPESGLYGSVRTANYGNALASSFHEGIDIAAMKRDRAGRPLDSVHAAADGMVGYINKYPGNSNYGIYVVLLHRDPVGWVYTLYAHLAEPARGLRIGQAVTAGTVIGRMGNTSSTGIPMERAHLHFEIGLIDNSRFAAWFRAQHLKPDHGNFNGQNFFGVNPRQFLQHQRQEPELSFLSHLAGIQPGFELLLNTSRPIDFFQKHPKLWEGPAQPSGAVFLACSESGLPLRGRPATGEEMEKLGRQKTMVWKVDEEVIGRNGCHLIARSPQGWELAPRGEKWLEVLTY